MRTFGTGLFGDFTFGAGIETLPAVKFTASSLVRVSGSKLLSASTRMQAVSSFAVASSQIAMPAARMGVTSSLVTSGKFRWDYRDDGGTTPTWTEQIVE